MTHLLVWLIGLAVLGSAPLQAQEFDRTRAATDATPVVGSAPPDSGAWMGLGQVSFREGLLARLPQRLTQWLDAPLRSRVEEGDRVRTGPEGRAEIQFRSRNLVRLAPSTTLRLDRLVHEEQEAGLRVDLQLERGELWAELEDLEDEDEFTLGSKVMGAAITGTGLRMRVDEGEETVLSVLHGEVRVAADRGMLKQARHVVEVDSLARLLERPAPTPVTRAPHPVAGPVPVEGPREISLEEWLVVVKSRQEIRIGADGRVRAAGAMRPEAESDWSRWNEQRNALPPRP